MTETEEQDLHDLGEEIAGAMSGAWEPACLARAFATPGPDTVDLTMQGWIDLDRARSPLLMGRALETDEQLASSAAAFGLSVEVLNEEEKAECACLIDRAVQRAFATAMPMREPGAQGSAAPDGFGAWLPMFAFLVAECHLAPDVATALRVDQAFALIAAARRNQGWMTAGTPYALREPEGLAHG